MSSSSWSISRFLIVALLSYTAEHGWWYCHCVHSGHAGLFVAIGAVVATENFTLTLRNFCTAAIIIILAAVSAPFLFGK